MKLEFNDKQKEFLSTSADVCLYGGGAGGGKSFALMVDALGLNNPGIPSICIPNYSALLLRKTYKELINLITESKSLYNIICPTAIYLESKYRWVFPSGSTISFGCAEKDTDITKYQGLQFSYIGLDEAGLWHTDKVFSFLMGRLRNAHGLINRFRMTSNPTRNKWLRDLFRIDAVGTPTDFVREVKLPDGQITKQRYKYIQALLKDNKFIDYADYATKIMSMDDQTRDAWLLGRWDAFDTVDGKIYQKYLNNLITERRLTNVPYDPALPLDIYFDLGRDMTPLLWVQRDGNNINIIDSYYNSGIDITHYIEYIKNECKRTGRKLDRVILPHDAANGHMNSEYTTAEIVERYMPNIDIVTTSKDKNLPREMGIQNVMIKFKFLHIQKKDGDFFIDSLDNYSRKFNKSTCTYGEPQHDKFSHFSDCLRYVCQDTYYDDQKRINNIDLDKYLDDLSSTSMPAIGGYQW